MWFLTTKKIKFGHKITFLNHIFPLLKCKFDPSESGFKQRCRRSSAHWHKSDPRPAVRNGSSSVDKHLRFISTVWREIQDFQLPSAPLFFLPFRFVPRFFLMFVFRLANHLLPMISGTRSSMHRSRRRQEENKFSWRLKQSFVLLSILCFMNDKENRCITTWTLCS